MQIHRHPCGFFYSQPFADFLRQKQADESLVHPDEIMVLDYIRCREGSQAGNAWWQLDWVSAQTIPAQNRFSIGGTPLALSRQTLRGLSAHLLHHADGQVLVKS